MSNYQPNLLVSVALFIMICTSSSPINLASQLPAEFTALVSTALCYYIFSVHMIVRTFCCQSVFSWSLGHSVWQLVKHFSFTCLLLIIFCLFDCFLNWSDCFLNALISGSPPGYLKNHSTYSTHKNHRSHLLYPYVTVCLFSRCGRHGKDSYSVSRKLQIL